MTTEPKLSWKITFAFCLLVVLFAAFFALQPKYAVADVCFNAPNGNENAVCIRADVADDEAKLILGLSNRSSLSEGSGMLFVFPNENRFGFWMKDMLVPLDIIWLNKDKEVIYVKRDLLPCSPSSCPSYGPTSNALYVIEVAANYTLRHNISNGTRVFF